MFSYRLLNLYGLVLCATSLLFAIFYLEKTLHLDPCPLCILDRVVIFGLGVIFLFALLHNSKSLFAKIYGGFCIILSLIGVLLAARHIWLQNLPKDQVPECGPDIYFMLETLPIFEVLKSLQCPVCMAHSLMYLSENPNIGNNKGEFIKWLFDFHTRVNIKLGKKHYGFSRLTEYNHYNLSSLNILWKNINGHCPEYCLTFVDENMGMFDNS